ncbi:MAG: SIMPL domain-containing protein [Gammaproteobacteria bacterium]|nr:SIMPL domain-containing protein [Gammaproteobacteria bacterium]
MKSLLRIVLSGVLAFAPVTDLLAQDGALPQFDLFSLHAEAQGEVVNDLLTTDLVAESEDRDSASLANRINASMQWALAELKRFPAIKTATRNYSTWPRYERKTSRIVGWHASQTLHIESEDFDAAREAIQLLQERLLVRNMSLVPRAETRAAREDELIAAALDRFKQRAVIVQDNMGAADYRIVDVSISTNQHSQPGNPRYERMAQVSAVSDAPAIQGGTSRISVTVHGRIQLQ